MYWLFSVGNLIKPIPNLPLERVVGKRVGIIGMARSGLACARLLKGQGARVFISDTKPQEQLLAEIATLCDQGIGFEVGGHTERVIDQQDYLVLSPGVTPDLPILQEASRRGLPIFSEIEVAFWLCRAPVIAVTGSNGKTTTVSLLGEIFNRAGFKVAVAGNIGLPFSAVVEKLECNGVIVLEVSSFQLERIEEFRPKTAALLNLSVDHLDRYPDYASYRAAKLRIFENQQETDFAVLNFDDVFLRDLAAKISAKAVFFTAQEEIAYGAFVKGQQVCVRRNGKIDFVLATGAIGIRGPHNLCNALAAAAVAMTFNVDSSALAQALQEFRGVEHRLEFVAEINGVEFINDSKATNVEAVWYALQSVGKPILLIAGGKDKGGSYTPLRELVKKQVKQLILIGQARKKIKEALGDLVPVSEVQSLEEAVQVGYDAAEPGEAVLLSPACASFDMFNNFEHRGQVFKQAVAQLQALAKKE